MPREATYISRLPGPDSEICKRGCQEAQINRLGTQEMDEDPKPESEAVRDREDLVRSVRCKTNRAGRLRIWRGYSLAREEFEKFVLEMKTEDQKLPCYRGRQAGYDDHIRLWTA